MNHDGMMDAMLWVGALFVFTPILMTGGVVGFIVWQRRKVKDPDAPPPDPVG